MSLCSPIVIFFRGEADAKGIRFSLNTDCGAMVNIDHEQMRQALLNLVQNAVEATEEGGEITVSLFCRENQALIEIVDTGRGIPEKERARIFNLYFTTKDEGTGMGLSIANQIIQSHGGIIEIESEEHQGSCFRIRLPLAE